MESQILSAFRLWDASGQGVISKAALRQVLEKIGVQDTCIQSVLRGNENGFIDYSEFLAWLYHGPVKRDPQSNLTEDFLSLTVVNITGQQCNIQVPPNADLAVLKACVTKSLGVPGVSQQLVHGTDLLRNNLSIAKDLQNGSILTLVVRTVPDLPKELLPLWELLQDAQFLAGHNKVQEAKAVLLQCICDCEAVHMFQSSSLAIFNQAARECPCEKHFTAFAEALKQEEATRKMLQEIEPVMEDIEKRCEASLSSP